MTRTESPLAVPVAIRLWQRVEKSDGCWLWTGARNKREGGYGVIRHRARSDYVHRVAYELTNGPIPDGLVIDHLCRTHLCVRPDHLEAVTHRENILRARTTHCKHGHPFAPPNVYLDPKGRRRCRTCMRRRDAQRGHRKEQTRLYRQRHRDDINARQRERRHPETPEKRLARRERNTSPEYRERRRAHYLANREAILARNRAYRASLAGKFVEIALIHLRGDR